MSTRIYGDPPYQVVVVHGGPGAPGTMYPVAQELSKTTGVLEPLQSEGTIKGQVQELKKVILERGDPPLTLIGHSWGAWLVYILATYYQDLVRKLILVSSGSFEEKYLASMHKEREDRLTREKRERLLSIRSRWRKAPLPEKRELFEELGTIMTEIETFKPITRERYVVEYQPLLFEDLMRELNLLRESGDLLKYGERIESPVLVIHGERDSTPHQGIRDSLFGVVRDLRFILLKECGHDPWNEVEAREIFFTILRREI